MKKKFDFTAEMKEAQVTKSPPQNEYLEEEKALEIDLKEREEFIRRETPDDEKGVICK